MLLLTRRATLRCPSRQSNVPTAILVRSRCRFVDRAMRVDGREAWSNRAPRTLDLQSDQFKRDRLGFVERNASRDVRL
jgi:hypothetical protein